MTGRGGERPGPGGLRLLLVPVICCAGPLMVAGLAAAEALAWGGPGLGLAVPLAGALLVIRLRPRAHGAADSVRGAPGQPGTRPPGDSGAVTTCQHAAGCRHGRATLP